VSDPVDLAARRWDGMTDPKEHKPADALRAALRDIEAGLEPKHLIVVLAYYNDDGNGSTRFYQAGTYELHARLGLLIRAAQIME
jgi:hypothetical protein